MAASSRPSEPVVTPMNAEARVGSVVPVFLAGRMAGAIRGTEANGSTPVLAVFATVDGALLEYAQARVDQAAAYCQ